MPVPNISAETSHPPSEDVLTSAVPLFGAVAGLWSAPDQEVRERQKFKKEGKIKGRTMKVRPFPYSASCR